MTDVTGASIICGDIPLSISANYPVPFPDNGPSYGTSITYNASNNYKFNIVPDTYLIPFQIPLNRSSQLMLTIDIGTGPI